MPTLPERPERSRNAKAQARHRAKRKAYIDQLEQTVTKLQTALGYNPEQVAALPPPLVKIRELEQENARLQRENDEMRRLLGEPDRARARSTLSTAVHDDPRNGTTGGGGSHSCEREAEAVKRRKRDPYLSPPHPSTPRQYNGVSPHTGHGSALPSSNGHHDLSGHLSHNGVSANGHGANGHGVNGHGVSGHNSGANGHGASGHGASGHGVNGHSVNGQSANGHNINGHSVNGHSANGVHGHSGHTQHPNHHTHNSQSHHPNGHSSNSMYALAPAFQMVGPATPSSSATSSPPFSASAFSS